jgi:hypothetical protein
LLVVVRSWLLSIDAFVFVVVADHTLPLVPRSSGGCVQPLLKRCAQGRSRRVNHRGHAATVLLLM